MSELIGTTIGHYKIEALLGTGGMGQVFRARHIHLERDAALKIMHDSIALNPTFQARFRQEARAIAALQHPHIVEVYDFGDQGGRFYLVMELLKDGSLRALLQHHARTNKPWPLTLGLDLMRQAADVLAYAHEHGMIHRDIKPDNMLLKHQGVSDEGIDQYLLKISDFGLARLAEGNMMTATGVAMGTPAYMSPEQCKGVQLDGRSDIYSLGVVIYEVTTGFLPFEVKTLSEAVYKHVHVAPPPPRQVRPDLPDAVEEIILRCLAKNPEERYATATELSRALRQVLNQPSPSVAGAEVHVSPGTEPITAPASDDVHLPTPNVLSLAGASAAPRLQVVDAQGQVLQVVEITRTTLTVGRQPDNDIALEAEEVSRQHARIAWDGNEVTVVDLESSNGSRLGPMPLQPNVAHIWPWREVLHIGPFWIRLEPPRSATTSLDDTLIQHRAMMSGVHTPALDRPAAQPDELPKEERSRISVTLNQPNLTLTPGQPAVVQVTLANLGRTVDHLTVGIDGVPEAWVKRPAETVQLNPGVHATVALQVLVPRAPESRAGDYQVQVRALSREKPDDSGAATARWTVLPFSESTLALKPARARGWRRASYSVRLRNMGNAPDRYRLGASDDEHALTYKFKTNQVSIEPGESASVKVLVSGKPRWVGNAQMRNFTVQAQAAREEAARETNGQFNHVALIPVWVPPVALALLLALCFALYGLLVQPPVIRSVTLDPPNPQPEQPVTVRWQVENADTVEIRPLVGGIDASVGQYTFARGLPEGVSLVASNRFRSVEEPINVSVVEPTPTPTVEPGAPVVQLNVAPAEIEPGQAVLVSWEVQNAESVVIDQFGTVDLQGQQEHRPQTTTSYRLTATNGGKTTTAVQQVIVLNTAATAQVLQIAAQQTQQAETLATSRAEVAAAQNAATAAVMEAIATQTALALQQAATQMVVAATQQAAANQPAGGAPTPTSPPAPVPPAPAAPDQLPTPVLAWEETEDVSEGGEQLVRYVVSVTNADAYPQELFADAPDLPPCERDADGKLFRFDETTVDEADGIGNQPTPTPVADGDDTLEDAARTWAIILDAEDDRHIAGFCNLDEPESLERLFFELPRGEDPPDEVYVELLDRRDNRVLRSNTVPVP